jgi:hypothetical protein
MVANVNAQGRILRLLDGRPCVVSLSRMDDPMDIKFASDIHLPIPDHCSRRTWEEVAIKDTMHGKSSPKTTYTNLQIKAIHIRFILNRIP